jgi:Na+/H+ antiporter NhaD/arsenite permease-like protein
MKKTRITMLLWESIHAVRGPLLLVPLFLQLLTIALMPFLALHWWERHYSKVSLILAGSIALYYGLVQRDVHKVTEALHEYGGFIILMAALFIVAGGIHMRVSGEATPRTNLLFLLAGSVLANLIGTTGASMLLIRPWIRMNKYRFTGFHAVFFIFLVSNVGGCLTPVGDPPLFLGFLRGVPFFWTLAHLWKPWLLVLGLLSALFFLMDRENFLRAPRAVRNEEAGQERFSVEGIGNLAALGAILGAIFLPSPWREVVMAAAALCSWYLTPRIIHERNDFTFAPIREVAWLFLGIFLTMIPALDLLGRQAPELARAIGMGPLHFYYATGLLSSVLDNAPTYLAFLSVDAGLQGGSLNHPGDILRLATEQPANLIAISLGAVFFGAMTYIGNGPNFMVRSIVLESGVKCPGFFGYILSYALPILLPVLALAGWIFLR